MASCPVKKPLPRLNMALSDCLDKNAIGMCAASSKQARPKAPEWTHNANR